jgi:hypothetical protein
MDLLRIYCYTGIPILTCNLLFYSITALSTSITSSQKVIEFISEHKDCDSIIFKNEMETLDIQNKLEIIEALIFDIIKRYCETDDEFERIKTNIKTPSIICDEIKDTDMDTSNNFMVIELNTDNSAFNRMDNPVKYSLLSTSETIQKINDVLIKIYEKIRKHSNSYFNKLVTLCLHKELHELKKQISILDKRLYLLFEILKIYLVVK